MKKTAILTGSSSFKETILENDIFVDKTLFIQEIIESKKTAILITRPRRWGKSLNLDMLKTFFSVENNESNKILFQGGIVNVNGREKTLKKLKIAEECPECLDYNQGKSPVIYMDFKDMVYEDATSVANDIRENLIENYRINNLYSLNTSHHKFTIDNIISYKDQELNDISQLIKEKTQQIEVITSNQNTELELQKLHALERQQSSLKDDRAMIERQHKSLKDEFTHNPKGYIQNMVKELCRALEEKYGRKVIILIDEYDKPVNHFFEKSLENNIESRTKVIELISGFMSAAGKSNRHLDKIILTGIFDTLKKEGNSGFNNVEVYGITDSMFARSFGFSNEEIKNILESLNFKNAIHILEMTRKWYNGYNIPLNSSNTMPIYSPWAVMNYFSACQYDEMAKPENYWAESGAANIISHLLDNKFLNKSSEFVQKMSRITLNDEEHFDFYKKTSFGQVESFGYQNNEKIMTYMLVNSGYVSVREDADSFAFRIPNMEVSEKYAEVIKAKILQVEENHWLDFFNSWHARLTYNPKTIDVVNSIINDSIKDLNQVLRNEPNLKCNNKNLKFNFFHLAAINGNIDIFNRLILHCKDESLLSAKDNLGVGLTAIDFAKLSNNTEIVSALENKGYSFTKMIHAPSITESIVCSEYSPLLPFSSILAPAIIKSLPKISNVFSFIDQKGTNGILLLASLIGLGTHASKYILKYVGSNFCYSYNDYNSIKDGTLRDFTKLITEQPKSYYLSVEGRCHNELESRDTTVKHLESDYNQEMIFTLCKTNIMGDVNINHDEA